MKRICWTAASVALAVCASRAQNSTTAPAFDAASVKILEKGPFVSFSLQMRGGPGTSDPGRMTWGNVRLIQLLAKAWDAEFYQIVGALGSTAYTITATMPPTTTKQEFRPMLQNLLIERFQIKLHHETRMFPGYELIVAPGGPKLSKSADPDAPDPPWGTVRSTGELDSGGFLVLAPGHNQGVAIGPDGVHMKFQNYTIADLAGNPSLRTYIRQSDGSSSHVVDKTGLTGKYDFTLKFDGRDTGNTVAVGPQVRESLPPGSDEGSGLDGVFKALEKQLGLKLVKAKGFPLDTIVIDHVEQIPTDN